MAVQVQPPPSAATRQLCAARLISLVDSASKADQAPPVHVGTKKESKSKKRKAAELSVDATAPATAPPVAAAAARVESPFLSDVVAFVSKVQRTSGVSVAGDLPKEMDGALSKLRESEALAATKLAAGATGDSLHHAGTGLHVKFWLL